MEISNVRRGALLTTGAVAIAAALIGGSVGAQSPAPATGLQGDLREHRADRREPVPGAHPPGPRARRHRVRRRDQRQRVGRHLASSRTTCAPRSRTATTSSSRTRSTRSTRSPGSRPSSPTRSGRSSTPGIDGNANVRGLVFKEHEGAYLVGVIFGLLASGDVRGLSSVRHDRRGRRDRPAVRPPLVRRLRGGREVGQARRERPARVGQRLQRPRDEQGARARAERRRARSTSSRSRRPATSASSRRPPSEGFFTSGVDTDQRSVDPAHIVESVVKRTDVGVYEAVKDLAQGTFEGGFRALRPCRERRRARRSSSSMSPTRRSRCPRRSRTRSARRGREDRLG